MITYPTAIGDFPTRVLEAGSGDQVLLLVHGLGARADRSAPQPRTAGGGGLSRVAFDLPGHGFAGKGANLPLHRPRLRRGRRRFS